MCVRACVSVSVCVGASEREKERQKVCDVGDQKRKFFINVESRRPHLSS